MRAFLWFLPLLRSQQPLSGNYPFLGGWLFNRAQNVVSVLSNWSHRNMVRTKKGYTRWYKCSQVCQCFYHILAYLVWSFSLLAEVSHDGAKGNERRDLYRLPTGFLSRMHSRFLNNQWRFCHVRHNPENLFGLVHQRFASWLFFFSFSYSNLYCK